VTEPQLETGDRIARGFLTVFIGLQLAMMMSTMDSTIVATALPSITRDLGGTSSIAWVVTSYLLAQVATMSLYGKISDVYGRKRVLLFAIALFTFASMACGAAQSMEMLLVARLVQGMGAGGLGVLGMAITGDLVPPRQLGRWLGYQGAIFAVSAVIGPLVGGLCVDHLSWRWAFYINVPLAVVSTFIIVTKLHVPYQRVPHSVDYLGSALLTAALAALVVLTTTGGDDFAWLSWPIALLAIGFVGFTLLFVQRERRAREPFVPLRLFDNRLFRVAGALNFTSGFLFLGGIFFLPVFFQEVAGVNATISGLLLAPLMAGTALGTLFTGKRVELTGRYRIWPIAGAIVAGVGVALLATLTLDTPVLVASMLGCVVGTGVGFVFQPSILAVQNGVDHADLGLATSTALLCRQLGGTVGTPLLAAVLAAGVPAHGATAADYASALPWVFIVAAPMGLLALACAVKLPEHPLREDARFTLGEAVP
jgi:EmrB/QacA subfamily drug resistance transporter